uniref:Uncharacterized protein n=1 Tax=Populus trichocarpa TaxID=3694 RepID=A9PEX8_POPTR|nr:unknown [Populus trichocarpa]
MKDSTLYQGHYYDFDGVCPLGVDVEQQHYRSVLGCNSYVACPLSTK